MTANYNGPSGWHVHRYNTAEGLLDYGEGLTTTRSSFANTCEAKVGAGRHRRDITHHHPSSIDCCRLDLLRFIYDQVLKQLLQVFANFVPCYL